MHYKIHGNSVSALRLQSRTFGSSLNARLVSPKLSGVTILAYATALGVAASVYGLQSSPIHLEVAPLDDSIRGALNSPPNGWLGRRLHIIIS